MWWQRGPIYQIYPRSFMDTNGDGIGDLEGIRQKLGYLAELGVSGIWLSPVYPSPMYDFGYDISNYRDIDPVFGNLKIFKRLVKEAEELGIQIIMDMVLNHSSHLHPWFQDASSSKDSPRRDWYIWADPRVDPLGRKAPNNWLAAFGGKAWTYDEKTGQYYLHLFTEQQPDFNWRNPQVKEALFDELRFWLDLGVKGFRLDVINYLLKDPDLRNNPYRLRFTNPRPYDLQHHLYDRNQKENLDLVRELRALMDSYEDTMLVGEVCTEEGVRDSSLALDYMGDGTELLHLAFNFSTIHTPFNAEAYRHLLEDWYVGIPEKAWPCHVLSNHDQSRASSRYLKKTAWDEGAKALATLLLTQRGTPFIYYGEELGMEDGRITRNDLQDPLGKKYYPFHPGRDRCRTPMQWTSEPNSGFSTGKPWLPVNPDYMHRNVSVQSKNKESILNWYKQLIQLRKERKVLQDGTIEFSMERNKDVLHYVRKNETESIGIVINCTMGRVEIESPGEGTILLSSHGKIKLGTERTLTLSAYESIIYTQGKE